MATKIYLTPRKIYLRRQVQIYLARRQMPAIQVQYVSCRKNRLGSLATGNCSNVETTFYMKPELNLFPKPMLLFNINISKRSHIRLIKFRLEGTCSTRYLSLTQFRFLHLPQVLSWHRSPASELTAAVFHESYQCQCYVLVSTTSLRKSF